uniref:Uncharacterized protein n=1 Tax=Arundo donax TaxID=35708 RepID=A0A0A9C3I5_ARUDO
MPIKQKNTFCYTKKGS